MLKITRMTALTLIAMLFVSCTNDSASKMMADSNQEHLIIRNGTEGKWHDSRTLVMKEILTIGETDQRSFEFASVAGIEVDESGRIYVCDPLDHQLKVYDSNGKRIMTIGNEGRGPGEFKGPRKIGIGPKGEICVLETLNQRVSIFSDQGEFLSSFGYEFGDGIGASDMAVDPDNGHIYLAESILPGSAQSDTNMFFHEYGREGTLINSFGEQGKRKSENVVRYLGLSFMPNNSLIFYRSYPYEMRIYSATGSLKRTIFRDSPIFTEAELMDSEGPQLRIPRVNVAGYLPLKNGAFLMRIDNLGTEVVDQLRRKIEASIRLRSSIHMTSLIRTDTSSRVLIIPLKGCALNLLTQGAMHTQSVRLTDGQSLPSMKSPLRKEPQNNPLASKLVLKPGWKKNFSYSSSYIAGNPLI